MAESSTTGGGAAGALALPLSRMVFMAPVSGWAGARMAPAEHNTGSRGDSEHAVVGRRLGLVMLLLALDGGRRNGAHGAGTGHRASPWPCPDWGDSWTDPTGQASPQQVAALPDSAWQPTRQHAIYPLTSGQALWLCITAVPPAPDAERWYLEIPYASVDRASLFTQDSAANGTSSAPAMLCRWPTGRCHPLLPIVCRPKSHGATCRASTTRFSAPLAFAMKSFLYRSEQRVSADPGHPSGWPAWQTLSLLSALSLRATRPTVSYGLSVTLMALTQASMTGIAGLHLWPGIGLVERRVTAGAVGADGSRAAVVLLGRGVPARTLAPAQPAGAGHRRPGPAGRRQHHAGGAVTGGSRSWCRMWWWRLPWHRWCWCGPGTAATASACGCCCALPVTLSTFFPLARIAGLIPVSFLTLHGMQIGVALELPVLLVILMLRSQRGASTTAASGPWTGRPATGLINGRCSPSA